jgi:IS30 family transposase
MNPPLPTSHTKPFQSKLVPFTDLIRELHQKEKSYQQIAEILRIEHGMLTSASGIYGFVKVRSKPPLRTYILNEAYSSSSVGLKTNDLIAPSAQISEAFICFAHFLIGFVTAIIICSCAIFIFRHL